MYNVNNIENDIKFYKETKIIRRDFSFFILEENLNQLDINEEDKALLISLKRRIEASKELKKRRAA